MTIKSGPLLKNNGIKLSKKEIDEITNKLHYDGELLKVKKQININEDNVNKSKKCNFSEEKLTHSSIIILIKKLEDFVNKKNKEDEKDALNNIKNKNKNFDNNDNENLGIQKLNMKKSLIF